MTEVDGKTVEQLLVQADHKGRRDQVGHKDRKDRKDQVEYQVIHQDLKDRKVFKDQVDHKDLKVHREPRVMQ
jgi:hypothetical protein